MEHTHQIMPEVPPKEFVAQFVRLSRGLAGWKKATLAAVAKVSLSTVERVERGDAVSAESLDRLAVALNQQPGAFTEPRFKRTDEEAIAAVVEEWAWVGHHVSVGVAPLRKQSQLRAISDTVVAIVDHDLDDGAEDIATLREWLELLSFVRAEHEGLIGTNLPRESNLRRLYKDVLNYVHGLERDRRCVCLVGSYQPETKQKMFKGASVAVVAVRSKVKNPAAPARRTLLVPANIDFKEAIERALSEDGGS